MKDMNYMEINKEFNGQLVRLNNNSICTKKFC